VRWPIQRLHRHKPGYSGSFTRGRYGPVEAAPCMRALAWKSSPKIVTSSHSSHEERNIGASGQKPKILQIAATEFVNKNQLRKGAASLLYFWRHWLLVET
jgi:hypothetical protein